MPAEKGDQKQDLFRHNPEFRWQITEHRRYVHCALMICRKDHRAIAGNIFSAGDFHTDSDAGKNESRPVAGKFVGRPAGSVQNSRDTRKKSEQNCGDNENGDEQRASHFY